MGCPRRPRGRSSPRSTATTCSRRATPTPFAVTAYQAAWLKRYYPLEFFVSLMNNQPMGFYPLETLKQDARRFGVPFRNPCVNRSRTACVRRTARCGWGFSSSRTWGGGRPAHGGGA